MIHLFNRRDLLVTYDTARFNAVRDALAAAGGNRVKAAALLDISRTVLYEKMEQYQLK